MQFENKQTDCQIILKQNIGNPTRKDSNLNNQKKKQISYSFYRYCDRNDYISIVLAIFFSLASGALIPCFTNVISDATSVLQGAVTGTLLVSQLNSVGLKFVYYGIALLITMAISNILWFIIAERQAAHIRKSYFQALLRQQMLFYQANNSPSKILSTFSSEIQSIRQAISQKVGILFQMIGCIIATMIFIFAAAWLLSLVSLVILPLVIYTSYFYLKSYQGRNDEYKQIYSSAASFSEQSFFSIKTVKQMNAQIKEWQRYSNQLNNLQGKYYSINSKIGISVGIMNFCFFAATALIFWFGSECLLQSSICPSSVSIQKYTPTSISKVYYLISNCYYLLVVVAPTMSGITAGKKSVQKIFNVIDRQPQIQSKQNAVVNENLKGIIRFQNVSFSYPQNKQIKVLDNLTMQFDIKNNAVIGESGSGKSSILQLILRVYEPDQGKILLDGIDICELDLSWLRSKIGFVQQEPVLFAGTIQENLLLCNPSANMEQINSALKIAQVYDLINKELSLGLKTQVGIGGQMLSGGQKQRIALARAILKNPKILLFDQFTSALDVQNERRILRNLSNMPEKINVISVSHRAQVMESSEYIFLIEKGSIIEEGAYKDMAFFSQFEVRTLSKMLSKKVSLRQTMNQFKNNLRQTNSFKEQIGSQTNISQLAVFQQLMGQLPLKNKKSWKAVQLQQLAVSHHKMQEQNKNESKMSLIGLMCKLFSYGKDTKSLLCFSLILSFILGLIIPCMSYVSALIYDSLFNLTSVIYFESGLSQRKNSLYSFVGFSVAFLFLAFFQILSSYIFGNKVSKDIRQLLYNKFLKLSVSWYQKRQNNPGVLSEVLGQYCETINQLASVLVFVLIIIVSGIVCCYIIGFLFCWQITLLGLSFLPFIILFIYLKSYYSTQYNNVVKQIRKDSNIIVSESLISIKTVTTLNVRQQIYQKYCQFENKPSEILIQTGIKMGLVSAMGSFLNFALIGTLFYFAAKLFQITNFSVSFIGTMIGLFQCLNVSTIINSNYHFLPNMNQAKTKAQNVLNYLQLQDEQMMQTREQSKLLKQGIDKGKIQFKSVSFAYQNREDKVFSNLSFKTIPEKCLAIVGPSGCGKSTIFNLLQRFYQPTQGQIYIDGINIKDFEIPYLGSKFGAVKQEPSLINDTILQCIRYGNSLATQQQVIKAAEQANALGFIFNHQKIHNQEQSAANIILDRFQQQNQGFGKMVGFNGSHLSGGQKQRLAIARMLCTNPTIYLFDEVTSALDMQNQAKIQSLLDKLMRGKTSLVISHKLQSLKSADQIIMMSEGKIVEKGTYEHLMKRQGYFCKLQKSISKKRIDQNDLKQQRISY